MIKMIKQLDDEILYWEVWQDGKTLILHYGTVGDTGETQEKKLPLLKKAEKVMDELSKEKLNEGFDYLDEDGLIKLVIQYSYKESDMESTLEKRHDVEDLMNECLGWTGNGYCDGGDIGSGTANIFNYVIDVEKAAQTIMEELKDNALLEDAKIAYSNSEDEEYIVLFPQGAEFNLM